MAFLELSFSYTVHTYNNRAATVLHVFMEACRAHGLPQNFRSDLGGENVEVWRYIVEQHLSDSAVITGSSTHNEG